MQDLNILCIGDVVGRLGRDLVAAKVSSYQRQRGIDFTVLNIENAAAGFGVTHKVYNEMEVLPIDAFTSGNHIYDKKEIIDRFDELTKLVRPLNFPPGNPGVGFRIFDCNGINIAVVNLIGRVFMGQSDCPFQKIETCLSEIQSLADVILVDFHAETTSETQAMGWFLDGRVSAVFGTHTHVQTADDRLLEKQTAYITDLGMVGAANGVLGMERQAIMRRFLTSMPQRFEPPKFAPTQFCGITLTVDSKTGRAKSIERIFDYYEPKAR